MGGPCPPVPMRVSAETPGRCSAEIAKTGWPSPRKRCLRCGPANEWIWIWRFWAWSAGN